VTEVALFELLPKDGATANLAEVSSALLKGVVVEDSELEAFLIEICAKS
jgi:hypothetical protein